MRLPTTLLLTMPALLGASPERPPWPVIPGDQLTRQHGKVDKDADAEALLWTVSIDHTHAKGATLLHHVRIKVFTQRGRDSHATVEIAYADKTEIKDVEARTVKPDGSIVEAAPEVVIDRLAAKSGKRRVKVKAFPMPALEPGAIVDYRWTEVNRSGLMGRTVLPCQLEIPVWELRYIVKPSQSPGLIFRDYNFLCWPERIGVSEIRYTMRDVPAFRSEVFMPSEARARSWMLLYYISSEDAPQSLFWRNYSQAVYKDFKERTKPNDAIRQTASEVIGSAPTGSDPLLTLAHFCRSKIRNIAYATSEQLASYRIKNKSAADTLKNQVGTGSDINLLFAALASAAGFEARPTRVTEHSNPPFVPDLLWEAQQTGSNIAVMSKDGKWLLFDPATPYVTPGMLRWQEEGQTVLVMGPKAPDTITSGYSEPELSLAHRSANLKLSVDGTLEGTVNVTVSGHLNERARSEFEGLTKAEQGERVTRTVTARLPNAIVSGITVVSVSDLERPFAYSYSVRVPGFAERTGRRLFFQPAFFQKGERPLFATTERIHPIDFQFPWLEIDNVHITLPLGYRLENAEAPGSLEFGPIGKYEATARHDEAGQWLQLSRKFKWGVDGQIWIHQSQYANLKAIFDRVHESDNFVLTLRQK